jgi:hypothetical protein
VSAYIRISADFLKTSFVDLLFHRNSIDVVKILKLKKIRWARNLARMGHTKNA